MIHRGKEAHVSLTLSLGIAACCAFIPGDGFESRANDPASPTSTEVSRGYPTEPTAFGKWLKRALPIGRIRYNQVIAILGDHYINLDRPLRDGVITIEYNLADLRVSSLPVTYLVLDFDADTRVLLRRYYADLGICGFCPHVFVDDGRWRLEGKLLAGCVGAARENVDALVLPRLTSRGNSLRVRLVNLAPEIEFLDQVALGSVSLGVDEELDLDASGVPFLWRPTRQVELPPGSSAFEEDDITTALGRGPGRVLVVEGRNTSAFQNAMRQHLLHGAPAPRTTLEVRFNDGTVREVPAVGTKFLRRIVVPIPERTKSVRLVLPAEMWWVHRLWVGAGRPATDITWTAPREAIGPHDDSLRLLRHQDGKRIRLEPGQEVQLEFPAPSGTRRGYFLKLAGYYEFLPHLGDAD
jgi:hypothetical protein